MIPFRRATIENDLLSILKRPFVWDNGMQPNRALGGEAVPVGCVLIIRLLFREAR